MRDKDIEHLAFSILHRTFNLDHEAAGGCCCELCLKILNKIEDLKHEEATKFYNEHYPPVGGFLWPPLKQVKNTTGVNTIRRPTQ